MIANGTPLIPNHLEAILQAAQSGQAPSREDCIYLLGFEERSLEAGMIRAVADVASRKRFRNEAMLLAQIGVGTAPCPGNCRFCVFGEGHTPFGETRLSREDILAKAHSFADDDDLYALFLMTMHEYPFEEFLDTIRAVKAEIPARTQLVVNVGDFDVAQGRDLVSAGANGAYHVCRLREGTDTDLDPEERKRTFGTIREVGLDFYYCCEPIGPEHSHEELIDQLLLGVEFGCFQHAAMRRVHLANSPLARHGQITELRLAQIVAVVALASLACEQTQNIAVHEPNLIGLTSGANVVYAEAGANPRDTQADTAGHRGLDMAGCRTMLYEAGFDAIRRGDDSTIPLTIESFQPTTTD